MHNAGVAAMKLARNLTAFLRTAATHDFFPVFSRKVRPALVSPLGVLLLGAATATLCGLFVHPRMFTLAGGIGLVVAAGVCWPWLTVRGTRACIAFDRCRAVEGEMVEVTATVTNHLPWATWGMVVRSRSATEDADTALAARLASVSGRARSVARWTFTPGLRNDYPRLPLIAATGFPFGIWEAKRKVVVNQSLTVWPRTFPVGPVPEQDASELLESNVTRNKAGSSGDLLGARPYRRGDSPRRIHWAQSARHDRLIVSELQSNARPSVLLILDADPIVHTSGPDGSREWAIRVAASLVKGWLETGAQVGAAWDGAHFPPSGGTAQVTRILDALARLSDCTPRPIGEILRQPAVRGATSATRIVVTTDAGLNRLPGSAERGGVRFVVLNERGFGGMGSASVNPVIGCEEGVPRAHIRPWLAIDCADRVPTLLRSGWTEARHGS
jgi:uncharacterized protein (DUF58 family)